MALCLVVEDQPLQRKTLEAALRDAGYQVISSDCGTDGLDQCTQHKPEIVLLDLGLPDVDGLDLIPSLLDTSPLARIVVLTGRDSVSEAVAALRAGARHYLVKPWDREELILVLGREVAAVTQEELRRRSDSAHVFWGAHPGIREVRNAIERLADSPMTPVLLRGETGTGKEVVAGELHRLSQPPGALVTLNCAAIPGELMESELFGHERGAFTGADARRRGLVELADKGTLLLDEIGEMSSHLQAKLLRFLQGGSYRRLGSEVELWSSCRVIASTHADLEAMQLDGRFRADLYYRLAVVSLHLPPLRERQEDLLPFTHFLLERIARQLGRPAKPLSERAETAIRGHEWPGNIRELANRLERALVLANSESIEAADLDLWGIGGDKRTLDEQVLRDPVRLRGLLDEEGWNISRVARRLGVARHRVKYRVHNFGLRADTK